MTLSVVVIANATGDQVFAVNRTLSPDERTEFDVPFPSEGTYTARVTRNGTTYTFTWTISTTDPDAELVVAADDGRVTTVLSSA